jgi:hypothetical protein
MEQKVNEKHSGREPTALRLWPMAMVLIIHGTFVAALTTISILSYSNNGFVALNDWAMNSFREKFSTSLSTVWTALPPLILQMFTSLRNWVTSEAAIREPFARLNYAKINTINQRIRRPTGKGWMKTGEAHQKRGGNAMETILMDYRSKNDFMRYFWSIRNKHWHLAFSLVLSLLGKHLLTPLSAALISLENSFYTSPIQVVHQLEFNNQEAFSTTSTTEDEWNRVINKVTSESLYYGQQGPWMNETHAFQPFSAMEADTLPKSLRITALSNAYAGYLNCNLLDSNDYIVTYVSSNGGIAEISIRGNITEKGCSFRYSTFVIPEQQRINFEPLQVTNCGTFGVTTQLIFISIISVNAIQPEIEGINIISCSSHFTTTVGVLTISWNETQSNLGHQFVEFHNSGPTISHIPLSYDIFEYRIITSSSLMNSVSDTAFGTLIVENAIKLLPTNVTGDPALAAISDITIMQRAIKKTYTSIYRIAVATIGFQETGEPSHKIPVEAVASVQEMRLFVRYWVAIVILAYALCSSIAMVWILFMRVRWPFPMREMPEGLLSYCGFLLNDTNPFMAELTKDILSNPEFGGNFTEVSRKDWTVDQATFYVSRSGSLGVKNLVRRTKR